MSHPEAAPPPPAPSPAATETHTAPTKAKSSAGRVALAAALAAGSFNVADRHDDGGMVENTGTVAAVADYVAEKTSEAASTATEESTKSGEGQTESVMVDQPQVPRVTSIEVPDNIKEEFEIPMEWERDFTVEGEADAIANPAALESLVDRTEDLISQGETPHISFQGFADDLDDTAETHPELGPGLGIPSEKNQKVADDRAELVAGIVGEGVNEFKDRTGIEGSYSSAIEPGVEVNDEVMQDALASYLEENGLTPEDSTKYARAFNRGQELPAEVAEIFEPIKSHRKVLATVTTEGTKTIPLPNSGPSLAYEANVKINQDSVEADNNTPPDLVETVDEQPEQDNEQESEEVVDDKFVIPTNDKKIDGTDKKTLKDADKKLGTNLKGFDEKARNRIVHQPNAFNANRRPKNGNRKSRHRSGRGRTTTR